MQTLKRSLFLTLLVLLAALVVIGILWGMSKSGAADGMLKASGRATAVATTDITRGGTAPASPQESLQSVGSLIKVALPDFLAVVVWMGIPGVLAAIAVHRMKRHQRQSGEA